MRNLIKLGAALAGAMLLVACHGDNNHGGDSASSSAGASPSLGLVQNATVNVYQADGSSLLGSGDTGDTGTVGDVDVGGYNGPVVVEVLGDNTDAMYFDEAAGTLVAFPDGAALHALAPSPDAVGVTPLTEIAYRAAVRQGLLPISADAVNELNEIVRAALAPGLASILSVPTLLDGSASTLADDEGGNYALVLAALAELGSGQASPALAVLEALRNDLVDGEIDGENGGGSVGAPYDDFLAEMQTALDTAAGKYGYSGDTTPQRPSSTTVDTSGVSNPGNGGGGGDLVCNSEPATLNGDLAGTYDLVYAEEQSGGPFTDGQQVNATVNADGSLQINGKALTDPQYCIFSGSANTAQVRWADSDDQIEYALTNNDTGSFSEINVGDASQPQDFGDTQLPTLLGQLREGQAGGAPQQLLDIAGDYNPNVMLKRDDFESTYALEQQVPISIDPQTGVITVDNEYTLDPEQEFYLFEDRTDNATPRYDVSTQDGQGRSIVYKAFIEDGSVIAHEFNLNNPGDGTFEAEERPLPAEITDLFAAFDNADQPFEMVTVLDDDTFSGGFDQDGKCTEFDLTTNDGAQKTNADTFVPFVVKTSAPTFILEYSFFRSDTRYADDSGDESLTFTKLGNRVVLRADGFVDFERYFQGDLKDRATNDPAEISAAGCGAGGGPGGGGALGSDNGASGTIDGTTETVTDQVFVNEGSGLIQISARDSDNARTWNLQLPASAGTHNCQPGAGGTTVKFLRSSGFNAEATGSNANNTCEINVTSIDANSISGTFNGTLVDQNDNEFPVNDGEFAADRN